MCFDGWSLGCSLSKSIYVDGQVESGILTAAVYSGALIDIRHWYWWPVGLYLNQTLVGLVSSISRSDTAWFEHFYACGGRPTQLHHLTALENSKGISRKDQMEAATAVKWDEVPTPIKSINKKLYFISSPQLCRGFLWSIDAHCSFN